MKRKLPWIFLIISLLLASCTQPFGSEDLEGEGTVLGVPQADTESNYFIPLVKRDFKDPDYPTVGLTSPGAIGLTGDTSASNPTLFENGDGTYTYIGKIFIETGTTEEPGEPIALNGADLTLDPVTGEIQGTAEIPIPTEGPFEGWSWEASTLARVMKKTGAQINAMLDEDGDDPLPLMEDTVYLLFILDGDIMALGSDALEFELPEIPNVPSAGIRMVLDPSDPMFYFDFSASEGFLADDDEDDDSGETSADNNSTDSGSSSNKGNPVLRGFSKFAELDGKGFGFSTHGQIPLDRNILWPFNAGLGWDFNDADGTSGYLTTDEYGNLQSTDNVDSMSFAGTDFEFNYGDQTLVDYGEVGDDIRDEIPIRIDSHIYMKAGFDFVKVMGIPLEVSGDAGFRLDPYNVLGENLRAGQPDVPFVLGVNGTLSISELPVTIKGEEQNLLDIIPIISLPDLGYASLMAEHTSEHNRVYFSAVLGDEDLTFGDFFDFSKLGDIPGAGFLDDFNTDFLSELCLPVSAEANFAGYFQAPPDDFAVEFRFNSLYSLNFSKLVNDAFGCEVLPELGVDFSGDFIFGYPRGLFWKGAMTIESSLMGLSMGGDTTFEGYIASADSWGLGFDGSLGVELMAGLGEINLANANLNIKSSGVSFGGGFKIPGLMDVAVDIDGAIDFTPFDFNLTGTAGFKLLGIPMVDTSISIGYETGIFIKGEAGLDGFGEIKLEGYYNAVNSQIALSGTANISLPGTTVSLANSTVTLSNSGLFVSGTLDIPEVFTLSVGGQIEVVDDKVLYEFFGHGDLDILGFKITSADVVVNNDGIYINGALYLPSEENQILGIEVDGSITNDLSMSLSGTGSIDIGGTTLASASVTLMGSLADPINVGRATSSDIPEDSDFLHLLIEVNYNLFNVATLNASGVMGLDSGGNVFAKVTANFHAEEGFSWTFSKLGFDITFGAGANVDIGITIGTDEVGCDVGIGLNWEYPWVKVVWVDECATVLGVEVCVPVPEFEWTDKTGDINLSGSGSISSSGIEIDLGSGLHFSLSGSGVSARYSFPVIGSKTFNF